MRIEKIDHICFAVRNLEEAKRVYEEDFGLVPDVEYVAKSEKIKVARYYVGEVAVEFMESTSADGEVAKFIHSRGEGAFLISYKVDNLSKAMEELKEKTLSSLMMLQENFLEPGTLSYTTPINFMVSLPSSWKGISISPRYNAYHNQEEEEEMDALVVGGLGGMGQGVARDLIKQERIKKVILGDINTDPNRVQAKLRASEKVSLIGIDVNDHDAMVTAIEKANVVINCAGPFYKTAVPVANAAVEAKVNYIDICDDYEATDILFASDIDRAAERQV